jgi:hypothetical protein
MFRINFRSLLFAVVLVPSSRRLASLAVAYFYNANWATPKFLSKAKHCGHPIQKKEQL